MTLIAFFDERGNLGLSEISANLIGSWSNFTLKHDFSPQNLPSAYQKFWCVMVSTGVHQNAEYIFHVTVTGAY